MKNKLALLVVLALISAGLSYANNESDQALRTSSSMDLRSSSSPYCHKSNWCETSWTQLRSKTSARWSGTTCNITTKVREYIQCWIDYNCVDEDGSYSYTRGYGKNHRWRTTSSRSESGSISTTVKYRRILLLCQEETWRKVSSSSCGSKVIAVTRRYVNMSYCR